MALTNRAGHAVASDGLNSDHRHMSKAVALQALNNSDEQPPAADGAHLKFWCNAVAFDNSRLVKKLQRTTASGVTPASTISSMSDA